MHPNPAFRQTPREQDIAFAREAGFGILCVGTDGIPLISHIPFLLSKDGAQAEFHLVRSNPIARLLVKDTQPVCLAVQGPHSYISPDWYGVEDQVPTWNYIAVHLEGRASLQHSDKLLDLLDRQSAFFENRLLPKPPWTTGKMTREVLDKMMRQIVPCTMQVGPVHGSWKLNQNKSDDVRLSAADHVDGLGIGQEVALLSALMRAVSAGA